MRQPGAMSRSSTSKVKHFCSLHPRRTQEGSGYIDLAFYGQIVRRAAVGTCMASKAALVALASCSRCSTATTPL
eukprot:4996189-Alexandrium_andersonii.AAC.1